MDKHVIEKFAVNARKHLIEEIKLRLAQLGIDDKGASDKEDRSTREAEFYARQDRPLTGDEISWRRAIVDRLNKAAKSDKWSVAYNDLVEEVAYTWFNRIVAIRFMEVNDYLPSHVRVLSSADGRNEPDIMTEAMAIPDDLGGFSAAEKQLYDDAWATQEPAKMDSLYRMLFLKQVDALNQNLPKLFENTDDYMKLLFTPSYNNGVIKALVTDVPEADFDVQREGQVEIIGWLYQYYNEEPKDAAFKKSKYTRAEIPAVTQLFTPDWIVKYLVENSLGRLWINRLISNGDEREPATIASEFGWAYFMPDATQPEQVSLHLRENDQPLNGLTLDEITFIDPSMGSGHILVYAFDVFLQLYESEGYSRREAALSIVENNLYGLDIDTRAYQLTYFALMMKLRQYNRRSLTLNISVHVFDVPQLNWSQDDLDLVIKSSNSVGNKDNLIKLITMFESGDELGSVISFPKSFDLQTLMKISSDDAANGQLSLEATHLTELRGELQQAITVAQILSARYTIAVTNPPYMGSGKMPSVLQKFVKKNYPNSKSDLFAVFMERLHEFTEGAGYYAMITQHQWMFLSSFENLRVLLRRDTLINLAHLGTRAFEEIGGEVVQSVAFVFKKTLTDDYLGTYERLVDFDSQQKKENAYLDAVSNPQINYVYRTNQTNFEKIPGSPIVYWAPISLIQDFVGGLPMDKVVKPKVGLQTGDNNRFLRQWFEVSFDDIKFDATSINDSVLSNKKWFPYNKGGSFHKWYGNYDYVVNWEHDGRKIRNFTWPDGRTRSVIRNPDYYFREAITWSLITSGGFSMRYREPGSIHDVSGMSAFSESHDHLLRILGLMNTPIGNYVFKMLNPTINLQVGDFTNFPVLRDVTDSSAQDRLINHLINLEKKDWDGFETSWNFEKLNLFNHIADHNRNWTVEEAFNDWKKEADDRFNQLKANEEELNRIFIDLYGLQDELTPEVADKDVSVRRACYERDMKALLSYFIGVTFGRYSLDVPGLAFAGGDWDASKYTSYIPNTDDVVMITDEDYFGDNRDIINRLKEFLTVTFGEPHLQENLEFIAGALGKKGDNAEAQIRKYFLDDFYKKDHLSTYQKRPIYWQLQSGKKNGFKALMYLHRYDENTMATIRTRYLHPLQAAYENRITQLRKMLDQGLDGRDKIVASKELDKVLSQLDELVKYDQVLQHVANQHVVLDLDDGVLLNHEKVQCGEKLLAPLK
ncbi:BREX-1 system adenine-specific DNA-methyltransferase PglX [Lacticaseibacillus hulanensis]|uniref:BREX-1 system adenine-specific DNA-methyltransferase PglX n=1 Tax=Lacticaseibacillus hulanensis TaxID=2493111 RepID=UPI000FDCABFB|nr:BREX-1 system adenine-specific DNA-methyltransferase PglX [Lacticaseibacillus hulanensis]